MRADWRSSGLETNRVEDPTLSVMPRLEISAPPASVTAMTKASWVCGLNWWAVKSARNRLMPAMALLCQ